MAYAISPSPANRTSAGPDPLQSKDLQLHAFFDGYEFHHVR
jgi:hypothetical protein